MQMELIVFLIQDKLIRLLLIDLISLMMFENELNKSLKFSILKYFSRKMLQKKKNNLLDKLNLRVMQILNNSNINNPIAEEEKKETNLKDSEVNYDKTKH